MNSVNRAMLTGAALVALYAGLAGACKREDSVTPEPTAIETTVPTQTSTPSLEDRVIPTVEATATPGTVEPYKLYCPTCTTEEFDDFNSVFERAYERNKDVYGTAPEGSLALIIGPQKRAYSVEFEEDIVGGIERALTIDDSGLGYTISHFDTGLVDHEISHRFLKKLSPTYHEWFDEGLAQYISGELTHPGFLSNYTELKSRGVEWINERDTPSVSASHLIGGLFFTALETDYDMTEEQNRTALSLLSQSYNKSGKELTRTGIEDAYKTALGVDSLDILFNLLRPAVNILYSHDEKIKSEF